MFTEKNGKKKSQDAHDPTGDLKGCFYVDDSKEVHMNRQRHSMLLMAVFGAALLAGVGYAGDQWVLKTRTDKESYVTGVNIVRTLKQRGGVLNLDLVIKGMKDGLTGDRLLLSEKELQKVKEALEAEMMMQKQRQAVWGGGPKAGVDGGMSKTVNAGQDKGPGPEQKPAPAEQRKEEVLPNAALATNLSPDKIHTMNTADSGAPSSYPQALQMQDGIDTSVDMGGRLLPDGSIISKRNQARLNLKALRAEMGARPAYGD